jgi:hypothetical protein
MWVITKFTESGSFVKVDGFSAGSKYVIELTVPILNGRDVYVFNGDVQNLAAPKARRADYTKFEGNVTSLLSNISAWRKELPDTRDSHMFICEARLMEALTPELNPILHVPTDSLGNQHHDAVSSALAAYFEEEDSRQHLLETKAENRL